jgi:hypothetical protein
MHTFRRERAARESRRGNTDRKKRGRLPRKVAEQRPRHRGPEEVAAHSPDHRPVPHYQGSKCPGSSRLPKASSNCAPILAQLGAGRTPLSLGTERSVRLQGGRRVGPEPQGSNSSSSPPKGGTGGSSNSRDLELCSLQDLTRHVVLHQEDDAQLLQVKRAIGAGGTAGTLRVVEIDAPGPPEVGPAVI